jgi:hypothetical protein
MFGAPTQSRQALFIEPTQAIETPVSAQEVHLTPEDEARIAKQVLEDRMYSDLQKGEDFKREVIVAGLAAVGAAIGATIAGFILAQIFGREHVA